MSRIGKKLIIIPEGVDVTINNQDIIIKGPKGELKRTIRPEIKVEKKEDKLAVTPQIQIKETSAYWGLERALLQNMVIGVTKGFEKSLEIVGVGFRAAVKASQLSLEVGFSHLVNIEIPEGLLVEVKGKIIIIKGIDKLAVTQFAAKVKKVRKPDVYKGKGIRYQGEVIKLKPGKKAATA